VHLIVNANIFFSGRWLDVSARQCNAIAPVRDSNH
jgi:hypothetical protein